MQMKRTFGRPAAEQDGGERLVIGDMVIVIKASAEQTGGAVTAWEEVAPLFDTPLHVHAHEDEAYYVIEGEHLYRRGDDELLAGPGDLIFLPRGVPHAHRRVNPGSGRLLAMVWPSGLEGFFRALADAHAGGTLDASARQEASERHGIRWLD